MGFAEALTALMDERGISGRRLARRVPCDDALICRYRTGKQAPSARMAGMIDDALDARGKLVALAVPSRRAVLAGAAAAAGPPLLGVLDMSERERLAWAQRHPHRIDGTAVRSLTEVLAAQRRADDALGSAAMLAPVRAQLAAVENLAAGARGPVRPAVIDLAQQWTQFAAWLHTSVRDIPAARALWRQTLELAAEAGDATMTATALTYRAQMAWLAGHAGPMIGLAQAAQRDMRAAAGQRAYGASVEARGHAMTGDAPAAERKLGEAADLASRPAGRRPWLYWCTPQLSECQRGAALAYLAAASGRHRAQALEALTAGYAGLGADVAQSEWTADYLVHRAAVHARGGDVAQACADAMQAVPVWTRTRSASLGGMLARLHAGLAARWPDDPRVADLADVLPRRESGPADGMQQ